MVLYNKHKEIKMKSIESFVDAILISLSPEEIRSLVKELTYEVDHQKVTGKDSFVNGDDTVRGES